MAKSTPWSDEDILFLLDASIEALRSNQAGSSIIGVIEERTGRSRTSVEAKLAETGEAFRAQGLAFLPDFTPGPGESVRKAHTLLVQKVRTMRREGELDWVTPLPPSHMPNLDEGEDDHGL